MLIVCVCVSVSVCIVVVLSLSTVENEMPDRFYNTAVEICRSVTKYQQLFIFLNIFVFQINIVTFLDEKKIHYQFTKYLSES